MSKVESFTSAARLLLVAASLLACAVCVAQPVMGITSLGQIELPFDISFMVSHAQGDTLMFYGQFVSGNSISIVRAGLTPNGDVIPWGVLFTYDAPLEWGNPTNLLQEPRNGKIHSVFQTPAKLIVMFTSNAGTETHVFDRSGIQYIEGVYLESESGGYLSASQFPNYQAWVCRLDFTTHTLPLFYLDTYYGRYDFLPLGGDYLLIYRSSGENWLLVEDGEIIQYLDQGWSDTYVWSYDNTQTLCGGHFYTQESDGVGGSRSLLGWVENDTLGRLVISANAYDSLPARLHYSVPQGDSTFLCLYSEAYSGDTSFRNYRIQDHSLVQESFFPDLSGFAGALAQIRMDVDYLVGIAGYDPYTLILADYPRQALRVFPFEPEENTSGWRSFVHSDRVLYWIRQYPGEPGEVRIFRLEPSLPADDPSVPALAATLTAWPNPLRGACQIKLDCPEAGLGELEIRNLRGQLVKTLHRGVLARGSHSFAWDGECADGGQAATGMYLLSWKGVERSVVKKLVLYK